MPSTTMEAAEFTSLVRRNAALIHKIALAYSRDSTDRDDVVQEITVQLWRSRDRYDAAFKETTWIYRIAINVAISYLRRERRHRDRRLSLDDEPPVCALVRDVEPSDAVRLLLSCLDELNPLDKALVLLYLDGNDHASTAEVLGISVTNVGTKLGRIKEKLRVAFERRARVAQKDDRHATR